VTRAPAGLRHVIAIAEPADDGRTWWISFPGLPGVTSAAGGAEQITAQARDALASASEAGAALPLTIEDGGIPPYDRGEYYSPLVVLVSYAVPVPAQRVTAGIVPARAGQDAR
jgi:predicted RNase H-like HicB family nuclease